MKKTLLAIVAVVAIFAASCGGRNAAPVAEEEVIVAENVACCADSTCCPADSTCKGTACAADTTKKAQ